MPDLDYYKTEIEEAKSILEDVDVKIVAELDAKDKKRVNDSVSAAMVKLDALLSLIEDISPKPVVVDSEFPKSSKGVLDWEDVAPP